VGGTEIILAWHIRSGEYRGAALAGVRLAAVLVGEQSLSIGTPPRRSVLFIDAADVQFAAAEALARERYGELLGDVVKVVRTSIRMEEGAVAVTGLAEVRMRRHVLPADQQGKRFWHEPLIPLEETVLGFSTLNRYSGPEFSRWVRRENGTTGYYGRFRLLLR
jgi:hypothetical protein